MLMVLRVGFRRRHQIGSVLAFALLLALVGAAAGSTPGSAQRSRPTPLALAAAVRIDPRVEAALAADDHAAVIVVLREKLPVDAADGERITAIGIMTDPQADSSRL